MQLSMSIWWSFILFMALAIGLAGCDSPSMAFQGIKPTQVTVADTVFSVRHTRHEAEAIRVNNMWPPPRRHATVVKGVEAIEQVSGCRVDVESVRGDTNLVASDLKCPNVPKRIKPRRPPRLDCTGYDAGRHAGDGAIDIECDIVE